MFLRWNLTVASVTHSRRAMSPLVEPDATSWRISASRAVSGRWHAHRPHPGFPDRRGRRRPVDDVTVERFTHECHERLWWSGLGDRSRGPSIEELIKPFRIKRR